MAHKYANNLVHWAFVQFLCILMFQSLDAFKHYNNMFLLVLDSLTARKQRFVALQGQQHLFVFHSLMCEKEVHIERNQNTDLFFDNDSSLFQYNMLWNETIGAPLLSSLD